MQTQLEVDAMLSGSRMASEFVLHRDIVNQCAPLLGWLTVEDANGSESHSRGLLTSRRLFPRLNITVAANPLSTGTSFTVDAPTAALVSVGDVLTNGTAMVEVTAKNGNVITIRRGLGGTMSNVEIGAGDSVLGWFNPPRQSWAIGEMPPAMACDISYSVSLTDATSDDVNQATRYLAILGLVALERQILFGVRDSSAAGMKNCDGICDQIKRDGENVLAPGQAGLPPDPMVSATLVRAAVTFIQSTGGEMPDILVVPDAMVSDDWYASAPAPQEFRLGNVRLAADLVGVSRTDLRTDWGGVTMFRKVFVLNGRTTKLRRVQPFAITSTGGRSPTLSVSARYAVECDPKTNGVIEGLV